MKNKTYSKPTVECFKNTMFHILAISGDEHDEHDESDESDKRNMWWSGDSPDNGDGKNSTWDTF